MTIMDNSNIEILKKNFSGQIILPTDTLYDQVRNTISAKGSPAFVVQPLNTADISTAIQFAINNSLTLSIRSGGHSVAGFSTNEGGIVIDLSAMNTIEVLDKDKHVVRVGAGAKWVDVAAALQPYNLALSSGDTKSVGIGGLTTGGGVGWMVRKHGLAIDCLAAAEIVTADGQVLQLSETENADLFWAIRGGGGNFGVITHFDFIAHPVTKVYSGPIMFALENIGEFLTGWRNYMRTADENLTTILNILPSFFGNPPMMMLTCCYASDDKTEATKIIDALKKLGKVTSENVKEKNYSEVLEEAHPPEGIKIIVKNIFMENFSDEAIQGVLNAMKMKPDMILQIRSFGGAMNRVAPDATAFGYRNSEVMLLSPTFLPPNATGDQEKEALKAWESIAAFGKGSYSGFMSTSTSEDIAQIYPPATYERLTKIKQQYDPQNVFNQNYNVKPS
jgi:hypothetical protein